MGNSVHIVYSKHMEYIMVVNQSSYNSTVKRYPIGFWRAITVMQSNSMPATEHTAPILLPAQQSQQ